MIVMDGLYRGNLNYKKAALLLYGLQIASINLRHLQLAPAADLEIPAQPNDPKEIK